MPPETPPFTRDDGSIPCPPEQGRWLVAAGWVAIIWYLTVTLVCFIGYDKLQRNFRKQPTKAVSTTLLPPSTIPHVTIIRPIKGVEPFLYECLAGSMLQDYPRDKLTVYFCIPSTNDPAHPVLKRLLQDFPDVDARIFIEPQYDNKELGPNPKIRNMSQAYREAKDDIVWIIDCNVWLGKGVCGRMVDRLCGLDEKGQKFKFVHHMPIVVDIESDGPTKDEETRLLPVTAPPKLDGEMDKSGRENRSIFSTRGGRLEELFLSSSHAKFYSAINTVGIAPCVVGKSSMFRRSHLNYLTKPSQSNPRPYPRRPGIDYFSDNICEDFLFADHLWKGKLFEETELGEVWGKNDLVYGDLAFQPMRGTSVKEYIRRRVRWLRVRKYTVISATLAEPGTESFLCSTYLAFGLTTSLPHILSEWCSFLTTWRAFFTIWTASILFWMMIDWTVYLRLHSGVTVEVDEDTPSFALPLPKGSFARRPFYQWMFAWLGREALALPIWLWSFFGGDTIVWRGKTFKVNTDNVVYEVGNNSDPRNKFKLEPGDTNPQTSGGSGDENGDVRRRTPNGSFTGRGSGSARANEAEVGRL